MIPHVTWPQNQPFKRWLTFKQESTAVSDDSHPNRKVQLTVSDNSHSKKESTANRLRWLTSKTGKYSLLSPWNYLETVCSKCTELCWKLNTEGSYKIKSPSCYFVFVFLEKSCVYSTQMFYAVILIIVQSNITYVKRLSTKRKKVLWKDSVWHSPRCNRHGWLHVKNQSAIFCAVH